MQRTYSCPKGKPLVARTWTVTVKQLNGEDYLMVFALFNLIWTDYHGVQFYTCYNLN